MLEVDRVELRLGSREFSFDLEVATGAITAVIGPSGAGKSTLLGLIAGFETPRAGRVVIDGTDVTGWPASARPVTTVFQNHNLFAHLSAFANVGLGLHPGLELDTGGRRRVEEALDEVGLGGLGERRPGELSGGEQQRVALARALVRRRPVLLLDEPFAALGPALRVEMLALVDALRREQRLTVLLVSHHPGDALRAAEETVFVSDGRILCRGPTTALLRSPEQPELARYLGDAGP